MPFHKKIYVTGNLFIHFKIKFPDTLAAPEMEQITEALKGSQKKEEKKVEGEEAVVNMVAFAETHRNSHHGGGTRGNDSDDEDDEEGGQGGPRVGCQSQ